MISYLKTVDSKPIIIDNNENEIVDLTAKSLKDTEFNFIDVVICPTDIQMRPDLLAEIKMGDMNNMEVLLKANEISNPFSLEGGDVLLIPDIINTKQYFVSEVDNETVLRIKKQYVDSTKREMKDTGDSIDQFIEREKTSLPPNYAKDGDKELQFVGGKIILGPNVSSSSKNEIDIPLAKQKLIEKLKQ
jgi:hypothetical protein